VCRLSVCDVVDGSCASEVADVTFPVVSAGVVIDAPVKFAIFISVVVNGVPSYEIFRSVLDDEPCVAELLSAPSDKVFRTVLDGEPCVAELWPAPSDEVFRTALDGEPCVADFLPASSDEVFRIVLDDVPCAAEIFPASSASSKL